MNVHIIRNFSKYLLKNALVKTMFIFIVFEILLFKVKILNRIVTMKQLDSHIFNAITKLQNNQRELNENSIFNYILKTVESLTTEQLEDQLRDLIESNKLENKPYSGRNSYFIVENEESTFPKEETPIP